MRNIKKTTFIYIIAIIIITGLAGFFGFQYMQSTRNNPQRQAERLLGSLRETIELPAEQPTIATVADASKLGNPILRERAQNNDKLLIFSKSKRLVVYRPSTKKVVEMLTIQTGENQAETGQAAPENAPSTN